MKGSPSMAKSGDVIHLTEHTQSSNNGQDDDSSSVSSSSSSDSADTSGSSGSTHVTASSSDGSSVVCILVKQPLSLPIHACEPTKLSSRYFSTSFTQNSGSAAMERNPGMKNGEPSTAVLGIRGLQSQSPTCEVDHDGFSWVGEAGEFNNNTRVPDFAAVHNSTPTDSNNRSMVQHDNRELGNDFFKSAMEETPIGPITQVEKKMEVDPQHYVPPSYQHKEPPLVHQFSLVNRPIHARMQIPICQLFMKPVSELWKGKFEKFNHLQSEVSSVLANSDDNLVVSAPTSAGKTALFEMAMARHLSRDLAVLRESSNWRQKQLPSCRKIVYISPSKALCEERYEDWSRRFSNLKLGIRSSIITGDAEPGEAYREIATSHLILTTPEKWDSLTRRWNENFVLFGSVKLVLVDEIHLLGDTTRGSCLESVLCRMKTIFRATQNSKMTETQIKSSSFVFTSPSALESHLRIVAVSATLPNIGDIAGFLDANEAFAFDDSFRPVPLTTHVAACGDAGSNTFMFNKSMNQRVPGIVRQFSKGKSTIVFCHTKKETELLSSELAQLCDLGLPANNPRLAGQASIAGLQRCLLRGVAYHNAGLDNSDRKLVERAFLDGEIKILCATSTLAVGVNLPAHLVVIKGTSAWRGSDTGYSEVEKGSLLQMIGRAGRVGFDTSGTAVIMTESKHERKYKTMGVTLEDVDSMLLPTLVKVLNTEISQKVITTFQSAKDWLATTFLFQCIQRKPTKYGIDGHKGVEACLIQIVGVELKKLDDMGCIEISKHQNGDVIPLFACHVMSQHLVDYAAMKRIIEMPSTASAGQLLATISHFGGLHKPVRRSEKKLLNVVHKAIKYKLDGPASKVRVQEPYQKAFVLLQAAIGQHFFDDFTLRQEMSLIVEFSTRMLAAIEDYSIYGSKNGCLALQSLKLRRSLAVSLWGPSDGVMNQLQGVGQEATGRLHFHNISSFDDVANAPIEVIEKAAGRAAPFGTELQKAVHAILRNTLKLSAHLSEISSTEFDRWVICKVFKNDQTGKDIFGDSGSQSATVKYTLIAFTDRPSGCLFFQSNVDEPAEFRFRCPARFVQLSVHLVSSLVGLDEELNIAGNIKVDQTSSIKVINKSKEQTVVPGFDKSAYPAEKKRCRRVRDPEEALRDGFKRHLDTSERIPMRSQSTLITPSPGPLSMPRRPWSIAHAAVEKPNTILYVQHPITASTNSRLRHRHMDTFDESASCQGAISQSQRTVTQPQDTSMCGDRYVGGTTAASPLGIMGTSNEMTKTSRPDGVWARQKRDQSNMQTSVFRTRHENPFAKFQYDPNEAETKLDSITTENSVTSVNDRSILPPNAFAKARPNLNAFHKGPTRMRTRRASNRGIGFGLSSQGIPSHMVLRMKGEEQLRHHGNQYCHHQHRVPEHSFTFPPSEEYFVCDPNQYTTPPSHPVSYPLNGLSQNVFTYPGVHMAWGDSQPVELRYETSSPLNVSQTMPHIFRHPIHGFGEDSRFHYKMQPQDFDSRHLIHDHQGRSNGSYSVGEQPNLSHPTSLPQSRDPADTFLEDAFF